MGLETNLLAKAKRYTHFRLCDVSSYTSEILEEIHADAPSLHVLFVPGNPGDILFYRDFVEYLYELLEGTASVTAIGHVSQTRKVCAFYFLIFLGSISMFLQCFVGRTGSMDGYSLYKNKSTINLHFCVFVD
ncbi:PREDICTED: uncharacterized protein LOC109339583 isoform X2 [Lupinus angustifolius]|uniref:uncharacterized protein LOC109339583 isoform X2 n=1 Tax=Lupinus angustifolius TaxID=3871 RepID=UPI00092ED427|nr:PREDICTED: uncharacterized protein LOC109339583 isoform X2 [Lupinus angustifolius]